MHVALAGKRLANRLRPPVEQAVRDAIAAIEKHGDDHTEWVEDYAPDYDDDHENHDDRDDPPCAPCTTEGCCGHPTSPCR